MSRKVTCRECGETENASDSCKIWICSFCETENRITQKLKITDTHEYLGQGIWGVKR